MRQAGRMRLLCLWPRLFLLPALAITGFAGLAGGLARQGLPSGGGGSRNREWQLVGMVPGLVSGEFFEIRKVGR